MATATPVIIVIDLQPVAVEIKVTRRDSSLIGMILEDSDGPIDFTGGAFLLTANPAADGSGVDLFAAANVNVLGATGLVQFLPTIANHTQDPATYFHDIQFTSAGGDVRTYMAGEYKIGPDISD